MPAATQRERELARVQPEVDPERVPASRTLLRPTTGAGGPHEVEHLATHQRTGGTLQQTLLRLFPEGGRVRPPAPGHPHRRQPKLREHHQRHRRLAFPADSDELQLQDRTEFGQLQLQLRDHQADLVLPGQPHLGLPAEEPRHSEPTLPEPAPCQLLLPLRVFPLGQEPLQQCGQQQQPE